MSLLLDASVVVALVGEEETSGRIDLVLDQARDSLIVTDFCVAEGSAAISRLRRIGKATVDCADRLLNDLDLWVATFAQVLSVAPADIALATAYVRRPDLVLRAPDAIHIATASRLDATLLTLDKGMSRAAAALGLPCLNPAEASALKD